MDKIKQWNGFFKDLTYNSTYEFLDMAKNKSELESIAEEFKLNLDDPDLALFKAIYFVMGEANENGCILEKEEVEKALDSMRMKQVDAEHQRESVIGTVLKGKIEGNKVIIYCTLLKSIFKDQYELARKLFDGNQLKCSFEGWGKKVDNDDGTYFLRDICFSGIGILFSSDPACPESSILELSSKEQILEFASKLPIKKDKEFLHISDKTEQEQAKYLEWDYSEIMRIVQEAEYPKGEEDSMRDILSIDFKNQKVNVSYYPTGTIGEIDLKPFVKVTKKGKGTYQEPKDNLMEAKDEVSEVLDNFKGSQEEFENALLKTIEGTDAVKDRGSIKDYDFAIIKKIKHPEKGTTKKIRIMPIHTPDQVNLVLARINTPVFAKIQEKLGINTDNVFRKILKKAKELKMKDLLKKYTEATAEEQAKMFQAMAGDLATMKAQKEADKLKVTAEAEVASKKETEVQETLEAKDTEIATLKEDVEKATKEVEEVKAEIAKRDKEIQDKEIATRKEALGDFATDMSDEDILDDTKYENATLKKEIAGLKDSDADATDDADKGSKDLDKGSRDKATTDEAKKTRDAVMEKAYGKKQS